MADHSRRRLAVTAADLRHFVVGLVAAVLWTATGVQPATAETLEQAWQIAATADAGQAAVRAETAAMQARQRAADALRRPTVEASLARVHLNQAPDAAVEVPMFRMGLPVSGDRDLTVGGVIASVPVFTSGRIPQAEAAARAGVAAATHQEAASAQNLKLAVARSYFDVLKAGQLVTVLRDAENSVAAHARDVAQLFKQGLVPRKDVLAVEVALADVRQQRRHAENQQDLALAAYNRRLGRALDTPATLVEREPDTEAAGLLTQLTTDALRQRDELQVLRQQAEAQERLAAGKRAEHLPSVALGGGYLQWDGNRTGHQGSWVVGAVVSWRFFDGGRTDAEAARHQSEARAARERADEARSLIALDVRRAWLARGETRDRLAVARDALDAAAENLRVARSRYRQGIGTNTDVLDAERENTAARTRFHLARYDAAFADIDLRRAAGSL